MKEVHKEQHIGMLMRNITGCSITLAALREIEFDALPAEMGNIANDIQDHIKTNPRRTAKQLKEAQERYVFIGRPELCKVINFNETLDASRSGKMHRGV